MYEANSPQPMMQADDRPVLPSPGPSSPTSGGEPRSPSANQLHAHFTALPRPDRSAPSPSRSRSSSSSPPPSFTEEDGPDEVSAAVSAAVDSAPASPDISQRQRRSADARAIEQQTGLRLGGKGKGRARDQDGPNASHQREAEWHGAGLPEPVTAAARKARLNRKERALWRWVNVDDLDAFLMEVYAYYHGKGIYCIGLTRLLNLLTAGFVIFFSTWLVGCVDYSIIRHRTTLHEVVIPRCLSRFHASTVLLGTIVLAFYGWHVYQFLTDLKRLRDMHDFFEELLEVSETDIATVPWHVLAARLSALRSTHPSALSSTFSGSGSVVGATRLDAHDVANRIMRAENYLVALFNRDLLNLDLEVTLGSLGRRRLFRGQLTRTLEWNLRFCLLGFLFGPDGQVRRAFLLERNRRELIDGHVYRAWPSLTCRLRRRFVLMGTANAIFALFVLPYLLVYSFFRYFEEYRTNPSSIGSRNFTQLARWKFREYNELPHHFAQRLFRAYEPAQEYMAQFPRATTAIVARFVAFVAGSFAAVLLLFSLLDPDAFLKFELTEGRTVIFYLGLLTAVLAVARGMVSDAHQVTSPEELMRQVVEHTHYLPTEWSGRLHSLEVNQSFGQLFQMKVVTFLVEMLSVVTTPFVLWYSLPDCAPALIDFFREFTVHVDGTGYVCSFALFDFQRHGDVKYGAPVQGRDRSDGKMERSVLGFRSTHPEWNPHDQMTSLYLSNMASIGPQHLTGRGTRSTSRSMRFASSFAIGSPQSGFVSPEHTTATTSTARGRENKARMYERAFQRAAGPRLRNGTGGPGRVALDHDAIEEEGYAGTALLPAPSSPPADPPPQTPANLLGLLGQAGRGW